MKAGLLSIVLIGLIASGTQGQDAKERLDKSPRHHEWVEVKHGERKVQCFLVFPEVKEKALAVIVIHENKGLTVWERGIADRLGEEGYIAIAPDLLSGMGPKGGNSDAFDSPGDATKAIGKLPPDQVTADLNATADYAKKIPAGNGKIAVVGFCWGGGQSFRFATNRPDLSAAFVFYGTGPKSKEEVAKIKAPVYAFYGEKDARVNATIEETHNAMKLAGKRFDFMKFKGAGHAFMRLGEEKDATEANRLARDQAWARWKMLLEPATK